MPRVLVGNFAQESCSFVSSRHSLDDFRRYYLYRGQEMFDGLRDGGMEVAGIIRGAAEHGVELIPTLATYGGTGGPVETAVYEQLRDELLGEAKRHVGEVDGALLALHGAMLTEDLDDPEGDLLARLREILGPDLPIVCSLDLHAHVTDKMLDSVNAIVAYHTHPHVDIADTGYRAMRLLARIVRRDVQPVMVHRKLPMLAQAERHNTGQPPMRPIMDRVVAMESMQGMLAAAIFPVQPWLDIPGLGLSVVMVGDGDASVATANADAVGAMAWQARHSFICAGTSVAEALRIVRKTVGGPVVIGDSSDATSGGADGDSTVLLRALLESPVAGRCLLLITDPDAVARCAAAGVAREVTLDVGGKLSPTFFRPVEVTGRVRSLSDGRFRMKNPDMDANRGLTAVLEVGDIDIVLSEKPIYTWDEECYRSAGLDPRTAKLVQLKSPGGFRPVYEPFAKAIIELDAPGPTDSNLQRLPYQRVTRPLFPLDDL